MATFNEATNITTETFPNIDDLQEIFYKDDFNRVLNIVKNRIIQAKTNNLNYAKLYNVDFINIPEKVMIDVKIFLCQERGYSVSEIENNEGNATGWKLSF